MRGAHPARDARAERRSPVRGHWCAGLRRHFEAARDPMTPRFTPSGALRSLDHVNAAVMLFCPYCGVRFDTAESTASREGAL